MKRLLVLVLLLLPALAMARTWQVAPASTLGFSGSYQGGAFHGRFKQFRAHIVYDPSDLAHATFDVTVKLDSVDTQSSERDQTLTGSDFFDTANHPSAHFVSHHFQRSAAGQVTAQGELTLNGITRPVTLKVHFKRDGDGATLDVDTTLDRLDYQLGAGSDWNAISRKIPVHGHLLLH